MDLSDLLVPERIRCHCDVQSKKRTLQTLAELLGASLRTPEGSEQQLTTEENASQEPDAESRTESLQGKINDVLSGTSRKNKKLCKGDGTADTLSDMEILDALISRERLGSTGLGHGVGLPHSRLSCIQKPVAALVTLANGVDYEAADDQPVDLVLGLLVPEKCNDEHLKILAQLARRFSDDSLRTTLRSFHDAGQLYTHIVSLPTVDD